MPRYVDASGLEITPGVLIRAYAMGVFPMADSADTQEIFWVRPERRAVIPLHGFHASRRLRRTLRRHSYQLCVDTDFAAVIHACATAPGRSETWINETIRQLYGELFEMGVCHTVEVWDDDRLVGGLYGLALGGAFFGESMFHRATDASKIALAHLVDRLNAGGFSLLDVQFMTEHLRSLGAVEISRRDYETHLAAALPRRGDFHAMESRYTRRRPEASN
jgi:leucyl/phenylalanyl-tRNA--protein transferase